MVSGRARRTLPRQAALGRDSARGIGGVLHDGRLPPPSRRSSVARWSASIMRNRSQIAPASARMMGTETASPTRR